MVRPLHQPQHIWIITVTHEAAGMHSIKTADSYYTDLNLAQKAAETIIRLYLSEYDEVKEGDVKAFVGTKIMQNGGKVRYVVRPEKVVRGI